jgi:glyoxylase-like metal-dependent hydrolase (beta-lactamase superfamily II)
VRSRAQVAAGISTTAVPTPWPVGPVNVYLIEDEPLTLVDTGPYSDMALFSLREGLAERGYALGDVERVLVTHQHLDHWGLASTVVQESGAELHALAGLADWFSSYPASIEAEDRLTERILERHGASERWLATVSEHNRQARAFAIPATVTNPLHDGGVLEFAHRRLRVLHLPGHSPSDTVFHDEERAMLVAGDVLLGHQRSSAVIAPPLDGSEVHVRPRAFAQYVESLEALSALELDLLLPGHGEPVHDHREIIAQRLQRYDETTARVADLIADEPLTASEIVLKLKGRVVDAASFFALCEVLGYLDRLLDAGTVIETDTDSVKRFVRAPVRSA